MGSLTGAETAETIIPGITGRKSDSTIEGNRYTQAANHTLLVACHVNDIMWDIMYIIHQRT